MWVVPALDHGYVPLVGDWPFSVAAWPPIHACKEKGFGLEETIFERAWFAERLPLLAS